MAKPVLSLNPTSWGTIEGDPVYPGDQIHCEVTISDADTRVEKIDSTGVEPGTNVPFTVHTDVNFGDVHTIAWRWGDEGDEFGFNLNPVVIIAPERSSDLVCVVQDLQGNEVTVVCPVTITPPPPTTTFGICLDPHNVMIGSKLTRQAEYDKYVALCGKPDYYRVYLGPGDSTVDSFPSSWPIPGDVADFADRGCVLSAKFDQVKLAAGLYDAKIRSLCTLYPGTFLVIVDHHECEDDIEAGAFTAAQWRAGADHMAGVVNGLGLDHVEPWAILMGWTWDAASGRNPENYWVPSLKGYAVDTYNDASARHDNVKPWKTPAQLMGPFLDWCATKRTATGEELETGWTEFGCCPDFADPTRAANYISGAVTYAKGRNVRLMSYFNAPGPKGDWSLCEVVRRNAYYPAKPLGAITLVTPDTARPMAWKAVIS